MAAGQGAVECVSAPLRAFGDSDIVGIYVDSLAKDVVFQDPFGHSVIRTVQVQGVLADQPGRVSAPFRAFGDSDVDPYTLFLVGESGFQHPFGRSVIRTIYHVVGVQHRKLFQHPFGHSVIRTSR